MSEPQAVSERVVTRGLIGEFGVVAILQALSLSRQFTAVELFAQDGTLAGRVLLKAGMVLGAFIPGGSLDGPAAFREIVSQNLRSFQVERLPPPPAYPAPIGRLSTQLLAARAASQHPLSPAAQPAGSGVERERPVPSVSRVFAPRIVQPPVEKTPQVEANAAPEALPQPVASPAGEQRSAAERVVRESARPTGSPAGDLAPIVAMASPKGGSGKTTLALNLAVSLAQSGLSVVLVDADPNGDVLSSISARERATAGLFDAVAGEVDASQLLLNTAVANLKVVPSLGPSLPHGISNRLSDTTMCRLVFDGLRSGADVVVVDTPAGMFGISAQVLELCTHVIGVLQAESIAKRSFSMFRQGLDALVRSPTVAGVALNMFRRSHGASLSVLLDAGVDLPESWLFQTTIPRSDVFLEASDAGKPIRFAESDAASLISLLFDTLASEVRERLGLSQTKRPKLAGSFVL